MALVLTDFDKIWASTSPLTPYSFSDSQYKEGWNFIGGTPPSRQMWDYLQKSNDEKMQYLAYNYLPLSGGTLTGDVLGVTPPNGDNSKKLANTEFIQAFANILVPVGVVQAFAGNTVPDGWLLCDGSAISRTDYADLYAVIGDTYGDGDGSSTFNLPNLIDKFVQGNATAGTVKSAGLPNITGTQRLGWSDSSAPSLIVEGGNSGAFASLNNLPVTNQYRCAQDSTKLVGTSMNAISIDASRSSSIYGSSTTVQPPALTMQYIIKY